MYRVLIFVRILVIGAAGAIGSFLVPQLRERGHDVVGTSRSPGRFEQLRAQGADAIALDVLDAAAVREALASVRPDAIVYEATSLAELKDLKHFDRSFAPTNRLRTEGTDILVAAAREAGVRRVVAQSFACNRYIPEGGPVKTEDDPDDPNPPAAMRATVAAMAHLDRTVSGAGGIALRYGAFYGERDNALVAAIRAGKFPIVGSGNGVWSHVHLADAAAATVLAVERDGPGIYNVVDDEPAAIKVWLPEVARIAGAKPPQHFPAWIARLLAGEALVYMSTESRGASNAKAKRELGFTPKYPSWREGFAAAYAAAS